jgi:hypothetical protein
MPVTTKPVQSIAELEELLQTLHRHFSQSTHKFLDMIRFERTFKRAFDKFVHTINFTESLSFGHLGCELQPIGVCLKQLGHDGLEGWNDDTGRYEGASEQARILMLAHIEAALRVLISQPRVSMSASAR